MSQLRPSAAKYIKKKKKKKSLIKRSLGDSIRPWTQWAGEVWEGREGRRRSRSWNLGERGGEILKWHCQVSGQTANQLPTGPGLSPPEPSQKRRQNLGIWDPENGFQLCSARQSLGSTSLHLCLSSLVVKLGIKVILASSGHVGIYS